MEPSQQISDKACALFFEYGIRSITMSHIAARLGMSKKTIYKYFGNKDALVKTVVANIITQYISDYKKIKTRQADAIMDLFTVMIHSTRLQLKFNEAVMADLQKAHPAAYSLLVDHQNHFIYGAIEEALNNGIRQQLFTKNFNVHSMARFFLESIATVSVMATASTNALSPADLQKEIFGHMINGIATSDGIELIGRYRNEHELLLLLKPGNHIFLNA